MSCVYPYCKKPAKLVRNSIGYYRANYGPIWVCDPCKAWVGCHRGTTNPKGTPANEVLRKARIRAHAAFDPLWRRTLWDRKDAYVWLAEKMGIAREKCHIGLFSVEQCEEVIRVCNERRGKFVKGDSRGV